MISLILSACHKQSCLGRGELLILVVKSVMTFSCLMIDVGTVMPVFLGCIFKKAEHASEQFHGVLLQFQPLGSCSDFTSIMDER